MQIKITLYNMIKGNKISFVLFFNFKWFEKSKLFLFVGEKCFIFFPSL